MPIYLKNEVFSASWIEIFDDSNKIIIPTINIQKSTSILLMKKIASLLLAAVLPAQAAVVYHEAIDGDLSGAFASPTNIILTTGANTIIATMGNNGNTGATNGRDADYFRISLLPGHFLTSFTLDSYTFAPTNPGISFAAYVAAASFTGQTEEDIDGTAFINAASGEILDDFTSTPNPLGPGTYSFWFQETSATVVDYQITLHVIPEPCTTVLATLGFLMAARRQRSHKLVFS